MAKTKSVQVQMKAILDEFSDKVNEVLKSASEEVSEQAAEKLRSNSPGDGSYSSGWTVSQQNKAYIVHNATDYQLTHLLENGHVIKNQYGEYGRWEPKKKHIKPVETWANREFQRQIERGLEKP